MSEQQPPPPSPLHFFETVNAYQRSAAIRAAIELNVFTAVGEGHASVEELARRCAASERGMRILCDYLVLHDFLTKDAGRYGLTPDSAVFLDRRSPAYMGGAIEFLLSPTITEGFKDMTNVVRRGGTTLAGDGTVSQENPVWVSFARAMAPMMQMPAQLMAQMLDGPRDRKLKILDVAAGHGVFGIAFAREFPRAEIVALDWPKVLEVAQENALQAGVGERYRTLAGSAFEVEYGEGYDLILLTNFLHHFDPPTCETLLRKVHAALGDGGRAVTLEFVPDEDRVSPPVAAAFSLTMLASTPAGDAYTFAELEQMFRNAGFARSRIQPLPPAIQHVIVSGK
ncbi:MAG TPA: class I SAM-dependent methyltransferase [Pyrinomonadaceae bacterium]|jgi:ubiquinone/menaquinone biosynthesis C-methylase UbiE|nr:class I SAM-dependent methyltransferase [Pyrinomonadaceae bacterium]